MRSEVHAGFWALYASVYDLANDSPLTKAVANAAADRFPGTGQIVDLGCGTGLASSALSGLGRRVIGVDASPAMLRRAQRRGRIAVSVEADAARTGLPDDCAAGVVCANLLHLHPHPERVIAEALRIVAPGGRIVWVTPDLDLDLAALVRADRESGRSVRATIAADVVRRNIALAASIGGVRVLPADRVLCLLARELAGRGLEWADEESVLGVQRIVVVDVPL